MYLKCWNIFQQIFTNSLWKTIKSISSSVTLVTSHVFFTSTFSTVFITSNSYRTFFITQTFCKKNQIKFFPIVYTNLKIDHTLRIWKVPPSIFTFVTIMSCNMFLTSTFSISHITNIVKRSLHVALAVWKKIVYFFAKCVISFEKKILFLFSLPIQFGKP